MTYAWKTKITTFYQLKEILMGWTTVEDISGEPLH